MIFTPNYKQKADERLGGVGYEFNIITPLLKQNLKTNEKYIGVLREGDWHSSVPTNMGPYLHCDLRSSDTYDENLKQLIDQIINTPVKSFSKPITMEGDYKPIDQIVPVLKQSVEVYFNKLIGAGGKNSLEQALLKPKVKLLVDKWENEIRSH